MPSQHTLVEVSDEDSLRSETFPALMVQDDKGESHPIMLHTLSVDVVVVGNIATTTMNMLFYNDDKRDLEGELYFPLGEGQTVSRFAMEVNGQLREGVIVEKAKGQQVFESVIRQNIDPGLLEWTQGNNFKARVFPIPSKGYKRIVVAYEQELDMMDQSYMYQLPMNFKEVIPNFDLRVEVLRQEVQPIVDPNSLINLEFEAWEENYVASYQKKDFKAGRYIGIGLPWPQNKLAVFTERVPNTTDDFYYYITLAPRKSSSERSAPKKIALVWDASGSGNQRDIVREMSLMDAYFKSLGTVEVALYALRNDVQKVQTFTINGGDWTGLKQRIEQLEFDGASCYRSIDYASFKSDAVLLFGDGLSNFGVPNTGLPKIPIYAINSSSSANHSYMNYLASVSGGAYINLLKTEHRGALNLLKGTNFRYFGNGLFDSYPSLPTTMGDQIHVAGIIHGKTELDFQFGTDEANSSEHITIDPLNHLTDKGVLRRIWAQKKLAELDIYPEENNEAITALGKEYGLVTRTTSLIVLDRVEDYVQHEITPPQELQASYFAQLKEKRNDADSIAKAHTAQVKADFLLYVEWWKSDFSEAQKMPLYLSDSTVTLEENMSVDIPNEPSRLMESDRNVSEVGSAIELDEVQNAAIRPEPNVSDQKKKEAEETTASIQLTAWQPDAPYLKELKAVTGAERYKQYLELKKEHGKTPSFYLDVSDLFFDSGDTDMGLRILSNIAELELENHALLRILAHRLEQLKKYELAIKVFEQVLQIRKEEPQSYRDLGLCLDKNGEHQKAIDLLYHVVQNVWDSRFPDIEGIALVEINRIVGRNKGLLNLKNIDPELITDLDLDVRIILTWDTDNCDMDLWVTDPVKEKCYYSNKSTRIGGRMSNDFTGGYGPEMFTLKKAMKGKYLVEINYYGTRSQQASGPTTIQMKLITNYGRPNEEVQEITRRLTENKEILDIGTLVFE